jgi:hypothetical protein
MVAWIGSSRRRKALNVSSAPALGGEKVSREALRSPSQPFICEGWVPGLFSKSITDRIGLNNPRRVLIRLGLLLRVFILHAKLCPWAAPS